MNSQNRSTLITTLLSLFTIAFIVASCFLTAKIPSLVIAGFLLVAEIFIVVPMMNIYYYRLWDVDLGPKRILNFVPLYNYTISMSKAFAIIYVIALVLFAAVTSFVLFPNLFDFMPERIVFRASDVIPPIQFLLLIIINIAVGLGLLPICYEVEKYYSKNFGSKSRGLGKLLSKIPFLTVAMLFIPILRTVPLAMACDQSVDLVKLNIHFKEEN